MRTLMILITVMVLAGCTGNEAVTKAEDMKTVCLNGVMYYQFTEYSGYQGYGFMSPKYNRDGTIVLCGVIEDYRR